MSPSGSYVGRVRSWSVLRRWPAAPDRYEQICTIDQVKAAIFSQLDLVFYCCRFGGGTDRTVSTRFCGPRRRCCVWAWASLRLCWRGGGEGTLYARLFTSSPALMLCKTAILEHPECHQTVNLIYAPRFFALTGHLPCVKAHHARAATMDAACLLELCTAERQGRPEMLI